MCLIQKYHYLQCFASDSQNYFWLKISAFTRLFFSLWLCNLKIGYTISSYEHFHRLIWYWVKIEVEWKSNCVFFFLFVSTFYRVSLKSLRTNNTSSVTKLSSRDVVREKPTTMLVNAWSSKTRTSTIHQNTAWLFVCRTAMLLPKLHTHVSKVIALCALLTRTNCQNMASRWVKNWPITWQM